MFETVRECQVSGPNSKNQKEGTEFTHSNGHLLFGCDNCLEKVVFINMTSGSLE